MKTILILGAGTAGTMVANKLNRTLDKHGWRIIVVDRDETHYYQPGFLFLPFGIYDTDDVIKPKKNFLPNNVETIFSDIELIEPEKNRVTLTKDNQIIYYDHLVIATGTDIHPEEIDGLLDNGWQNNIFDFYTFDGASKLGNFLNTWEGGRLVINIAEMPIKCPVAPLEFAFLADWFFQKRGIRDKVEIVYSTPLDAAFTKPKAASILGNLLDNRGIHLEPDFNIAEVDSGRNVISSYDEREIEYDLLVTIPTHMGADIHERSNLGDELNFVPTNKHTLQSKDWENIWVIGDAGDVPTSKAGAVAHFMLDTLIENIQRHIKGQPLVDQFDGHANCFIETGFNKAILIDFNYDVEPLPGKFPIPKVGPFSLLAETRANHYGKMMFRWIYWNILLKGHHIPVDSQLTMAGKIA